MKNIISLRYFLYLLVNMTGQVCVAQVSEFPIGTVLDSNNSGCQRTSAFIYSDPKFEIYDSSRTVKILECKSHIYIVIEQQIDAKNNTYAIARSYRLPKFRKLETLWDVDCTFLPDKNIHAFAIGESAKWGVGMKIAKKTYAAILDPKSMQIVKVNPSQVSCGYQEDRD